jgi:heme/copper-type cytochrome/quinol oxidase subunit 2
MRGAIPLFPNSPPLRGAQLKHNFIIIIIINIIVVVTIMIFLIVVAVVVVVVFSFREELLP